MKNYLAVKEKFRLDSEAFFIFKGKMNIKPDTFRKKLREALSRLNLDPNVYDTHSLRIGRASDLHKNRV